MKLCSFRHSSASRRVRIATALKGADLEFVEIDLSAGEQFSHEYLSVNPQGLVPALITDDGLVMTQSLAIMAWLDARFPEPVLLGLTQACRVKILEFVSVIGCEVHPLQGLRLSRWLDEAGSPPEAFSVIARRAISDGLATCEHLVHGGTERFCFSDEPSAADIWLIPQLNNARRFGVDLTSYPRLVGIEQRCLALAAFRDP